MLQNLSASLEMKGLGYMKYLLLSRTYSRWQEDLCTQSEWVMGWEAADETEGGK